MVINDRTNMSREEAKEAMKSGLKVTHIYFTPEEWATMENGLIVLEDGVRCSPSEFWRYRNESYFDYGWSIYSK